MITFIHVCKILLNSEKKIFEKMKRDVIRWCVVYFIVPSGTTLEPENIYLFDLYRHVNEFFNCFLFLYLLHLKVKLESLISIISILGWDSTQPYVQFKPKPLEIYILYAFCLDRKLNYILILIVVLLL